MGYNVDTNFIIGHEIVVQESEYTDEETASTIAYEMCNIIEEKVLGDWDVRVLYDTEENTVTFVLYKRKNRLYVGRKIGAEGCMVEYGNRVETTTASDVEIFAKLFGREIDPTMRMFAQCTEG